VNPPELESNEKMSGSLMRVSLILTLLLVFVVSGFAAGLGQKEVNRSAERLEAERRRLNALKDPVGRVKSYVKISNLLLDVATSVKREDGAELGPLVDQYVTAIQSARDTIVNSGRDPTRKPAGYKELEIALRQHTRQLQDIGRMLTIDERKPVEHALSVATSIREELIRLLFPQPATSRSTRFAHSGHREAQ
jgi:hypothetical protein